VYEMHLDGVGIWDPSSGRHAGYLPGSFAHRCGAIGEDRGLLFRGATGTGGISAA
jgi:hypothetical protein